MSGSTQRGPSVKASLNANKDNLAAVAETLAAVSVLDNAVMAEECQDVSVNDGYMEERANLN